MIIIGKNPILETLKSNPKDLTKIIFMKNMKPEPRMKEILFLAKENGISLISLHKFDFEKYFQSRDKKEGISQGMIGFMKDFEYTPLKEILSKIEKVVNPLLIILDEI
ncbi:MAG: RNA methyltransferase substrate-binding domain-containing protein, partial [Candidatus Kapaibacterium sp.]